MLACFLSFTYPMLSSPSAFPSCSFCLEFSSYTVLSGSPLVSFRSQLKCHFLREDSQYPQVDWVPPMWILSYNHPEMALAWAERKVWAVVAAAAADLPCIHSPPSFFLTDTSLVQRKDVSLKLLPQMSFWLQVATRPSSV